MTLKQEVFQTQIRLSRLRKSWYRFFPCNWGKIKALAKKIDELNKEIEVQRSIKSEKFNRDMDEYISSIQNYTTKYGNHDF
jgi:hypothetical protein